MSVILDMIFIFKKIWGKYEKKYEISEKYDEKYHHIFCPTSATRYDACPFSSYWTSYLSSYFWNMAKNMRYQYNENSSYFCHIWTRWNALLCALEFFFSVLFLKHSIFFWPIFVPLSSIITSSSLKKITVVPKVGTQTIIDLLQPQKLHLPAFYSSPEV